MNHLFRQSAQPSSQLRVDVRWLIRRDMAEVLDIEFMCFQYPWTEEDLVGHLKHRNVIGMVAEYEDQVVGHLIYEMFKGHLYLLTIAVLPSLQRRGIGSQLIKHLKGRLGDAFKRIDTDIIDTDLDAHLFFKSQDFVATKVHEWEFRGLTGDCYRFVYR